MKKRLIFIIVLALLMISVVSVYAGGGPNGTWVHFSGCDSYWRLTGSGLAHEWRNDTSCMFNGISGLHLVFKPMDKFATADCDSNGYVYSFSDWQFTYQYDETFIGDEADLDEFLTPSRPYHVCFYTWDHAELP